MNTGFPYIRVPIGLAVKLLNEPFMDDPDIWGLMSLILQTENVTDKAGISVTEENKICYDFLGKFKMPMILTNENKEKYKNLKVCTAKEFMKKYRELMLNDRTFIRLEKNC